MLYLPTEPVGSIPRPAMLLEAFRAYDQGRITKRELEAAESQAAHDTIRLFEATGSSVITDGEQRKPSFLTYPIHGAPNLNPGWFRLLFSDGHQRVLPQIAAGPLRYQTYAAGFVEKALTLTAHPVKQAVISASVLSRMYPEVPLPNYSREKFLSDLIDEAERDIRLCLLAGADSVQIDFTEARLAVKLDPSLRLLDEFIEINNWVFERFSEEERARIGVHACAGSDHTASHSAEVDYAYVLPALFQQKAGRFYLQLAGEPDPERVLSLIQTLRGPRQFIFVGVITRDSQVVETPEIVRDRVLQAAKYIPLDYLGTTDDCGFAPFADDVSTARETAFAKIAARVEGTRLARQDILGHP